MMEGTSGAADRVSLRGDVREATLNAGSRVSGVRRADLWMWLLKKGLILDGGDSSHRRKQACDRRCPSGSGWGKAPSASDRGGERSAMGNCADPYSVKPRLVGALIKGANHSLTL